MEMVHQSKRNKAVKQELLLVEKQEKRMAQAAMKAKPATWKTALESKIPQKVYTGLESAFCKGFSLVFQQGRAVIEKGYRKKIFRPITPFRILLCSSKAAVRN